MGKTTSPSHSVHILYRLNTLIAIVILQSVIATQKVHKENCTKEESSHTAYETIEHKCPEQPVEHDSFQSCVLFS